MCPVSRRLTRAPCACASRTRARPPPRRNSSAAAGTHSADGQIVEGGDRIRLRPQPDPAGPELRIAMIEMERSVEPCLHAIADRDDAEGVPLAERRRRDAGGG